MQISNWFNKINSKKPYFNIWKPTKGSKYQREERCDIIIVAKRVKHQVLYVLVTSILNGRSDVKIYDEIKATYECANRITSFLNSFCCFI